MFYCAFTFFFSFLSQLDTIHWQTFGKLSNFPEGVFLRFVLLCNLRASIKLLLVVLLKICFTSTKIILIPCPFTYFLKEKIVRIIMLYQAVDHACVDYSLFRRHRYNYWIQSKIVSCDFNKIQPFSLYFGFLVSWSQLSILCGYAASETPLH